MSHNLYNLVTEVRKELAYSIHKNVFAASGIDRVLCHAHGANFMEEMLDNSAKKKTSSETQSSQRFRR